MKHIKLQQINLKAVIITKFISPLIVIFFMLISSLSVYSQNSEWVLSGGTNGNDEGRIVKVDNSGNVYVAGHFYYSIYIGATKLFGYGDKDIFLAKYNSAGIVQWAFNIGSTGTETVYSMCLDASNNIYITGVNGDQTAFNPSKPLQTSNAGMFCAKYSGNSGNYIWSYEIGGSTGVTSSSIYSSGINLYITGNITSPTDVEFDPKGSSGKNLRCVGGLDIFFCKYDTSFGCTFANSLNGPTSSIEAGSSIISDNADNIYISGYFNTNGTKFGPGVNDTLNTRGGLDIFLAKYTSAGTFVWVKGFGGSSYEYVKDMCYKNYRIYITGYFASPRINFGTGNLTNKYAAGGSSDVFIVKFGTDGSCKWAKSFGNNTATYNDQGLGIAVDNSGNIYNTGYFYGTVNFGGTSILTANGTYDIYMSKCDSTGGILWANHFGGTSSPNNNGNSIAVDSYKNAYITGFFTNNNVNFGLGTTLILPYGGANDYFIAKYTDQASFDTCPDINYTDMTVNWVNGTGTKRMVFVKENGTGTPAPVDGTSYNPNTVFKSGDQIGSSGWYCVYDGIGTSVFVTGLTEGSLYRVMVCEHVGAGATIVYNTYAPPTNPVNKQLAFHTPTFQALGVGFMSILDTSFTIGWSNGNGTSRVAFLKVGSVGTAVPVDSTTYIANSKFTSGTQIGSTGWYCVYNGTDKTVDITGLSPHTTYIGMVCEYKGTAGLQRYNKSTAINNPNFGTTIYSTPTLQASNIVVSKVGADTCTLAWTNGNGTANVVFVYEGSAGTAAPVDNHQYTASSVFKSGEQIGSSGWYCVYYGSSGSSVRVSGLTANTTYRFMVCSFNGTSNVERYLTTTATNNPVNQLTEYTTPSMQAGLIRFNNVVDTSFTVAWTNGNGSRRAVFIKANGVTTAPLNHATYVANAKYGLGSTTAELWYCIYDGTDTFVNVTGLVSNTNYKVMVFEYNGPSGREAYNKADIGAIRKTKRLQTITFPALSDKIFTSSDFSASANASSGLSITYSSSDNLVASIIGTDIHIVNVGTCKIYAIQAGDDNYMPAKDSSSLTITKAPLTISVDGNSRFYGDANPLWITHVVNLKSGDVISNILISCSATQASDTGHYTITPYDVTFSDGSASNYDITYNPGILNVTHTNLIIAGKDTTRTFGEDNPEFTWQVIGLKNDDSISSVTLSTSANLRSAIGQYDIIPSNPIFVTGKASNYNFNFIKGTLDVTESPIKICLVSIDLETGYGMVIWERDNITPLLGYVVYRQTSTVGVYDSIGAVPISKVGIFIDSTSHFEKHPEFYKIATVNPGGVKSRLDQCNYHETILLQTSPPSGGVVPLTWSPYEVENSTMTFKSYVLYKGTDSTKLTVVDTIAANVYNYNDADPLAQVNKTYYRIAGIKWTPCYPEGHKKAGAGPFSQSVSNMEDNRLQSNDINMINQGIKFNLAIFPNPVNKISVIKYILPRNAEVRTYVVNILGETVAEFNLGNQKAGYNQFTLNAEQLNLSNGIYFLKVNAGNANAISKISVVR